MNEDNNTSKLILIVDDDEGMTFGVGKYLTAKGFRVVTAADGQEGLKMAKSHSPHLIILDVMMPKIDGWSLIRHLRIIPALTFTPIIFLSGLGSEKDRLKGFQLGADDFLPKPFSFEELEIRVRKSLDHAENLKKSVEQELSSLTRDHYSFKGNLRDMSLSSLITLCILERKSGVLTLRRGNRDEGVINVFEGEVAITGGESIAYGTRSRVSQICGIAAP